MKQALNSAKVSGIDDEERQFEILKQVYQKILSINGSYSAPKFSSVYKKR